MHRRPALAIFALLPATALSCAASSSVPASPAGVVVESITVTSKSFSSGRPIPLDHTCDGSNTSPDVTWSSPPEGTQSIVITLDDVEGGDGVSSRWIMFDIRPEARTFRAGADPSSVGAKVAKLDADHTGYRGPCPPRRVGHHFSLRVTALDRPLGLTETADREAVNAAMNGHVLGTGELVGTVVR